MGNISNSKCKEKQALQMVGCNNGPAAISNGKFLFLSLILNFSKANYQSFSGLSGDDELTLRNLS